MSKVRRADPLQALGAQLRAARKAQEVTMVAAAEAAGISRPTLDRIERGEPGVAIGAWQAVAAALGLDLRLAAPDKPRRGRASVPERIRIGEYPQLQKLAWQLDGATELTPKEALDLYERNWRHVDTDSLTLKEVALIDTLSKVIGGGRLLV